MIRLDETYIMSGLTINNNIMFEYTHIVKDSRGEEWGAFQNEGIADIMRQALALRFSPGVTFFTELIK